MTVEELIEYLKTLPDQKMPVEINEDIGEYEPVYVWSPLTEDNIYLSKREKTIRIGQIFISIKPLQLSWIEQEFSKFEVGCSSQPRGTIFLLDSANKIPSLSNMKLNIDETEVFAAIEEDDNSGFCIACGTQHDGVEPDARNYKCEHCGEMKVFGAEQIAIEFL